MIAFNKFELSNGLRVIVHEDHSTPFVVVNLTYDVGARDESKHRTGFAHLFEHLMFGGSKHAPHFDKPLELAGASNNAFTSNDFTNYYEIIPRDNLEVALFLESDRMRHLTINEHNLQVQRKVVIEEFKERYLNQPYGQTWHFLRELAYKKHPYQWPTIGREIAHIQDATLQEVQEFYDKHYQPNHAVLTLAGNISLKDAEKLVPFYFNEFAPSIVPYQRQLPQEDIQQEQRRLELEADVPLDSIHIAFPMPHYGHQDYYAFDLVSDVLGLGESSRLYQELVKKKPLFSSLACYISGSSDAGLFIIEGKLQQKVSKTEAEEAIWNEIAKLAEKEMKQREYQKLLNKVESMFMAEHMDKLHKAISLSIAEIRGDANQVNNELQNYRQVNPTMIQQISQHYLQPNQANVLWQIANS